MKIAALIVGLLVVAASAEPVQQVHLRPTQDRNLIVDLINVMFEMLRETMKKYDPFELPEFEREATLFQLLKTGVSIKDFRLSGFSGITLNQLEYDKSFRFDLSIPHLHVCADKARIFAGAASAEAGGRMSITEAGIAGDIDFDLSSTGITLNKLEIRLKLERIESALMANILGSDMSDVTNNFLNNKLVPFIEQNNDKISELLEMVGKTLIEIISNVLFS